MVIMMVMIMVKHNHHLVQCEVVRIHAKVGEKLALFLRIVGDRIGTFPAAVDQNRKHPPTVLVKHLPYLDKGEEWDGDSGTDSAM